MSEQLLAIGVDGARGGWVAAACFAPAPEAPPSERRTVVAFHPTTAAESGLEALDRWRREQPGGDRAWAAADVPIGLSLLGGSRACDTAARKRLGKQHVSVFTPPARFLVERFDRAEVSVDELRAAIRERKAEERAAGRDPDAVATITSQTGSIFSKVWETDRFARRGQRADGSWPAEDWLFEAHPELCFRAMVSTDAEGVISAPDAFGRKVGAAGQLQRLALVRQHFPDLERAARESGWSADGGLIDVLDAYAAVWTALRFAQRDSGVDASATGQAIEELGASVGADGVQSIPRDDGGRDGRGLLMRMVV